MLVRLSTLRFALLLFLTGTGTAYTEEQPLARIAFGSCAKQDRPQPIWEAIVETQPQLFVFLGDNIYGDSEKLEVLQDKWGQLAAQPGYQKLKAACPVVGTWDDHDYGKDDGGADFPQRAGSQQLFLDFLGVEADDPRRQQEGVYSTATYGPPGKRVQIILLDTRYFRSPLVRGTPAAEPGEGIRGKYVPNPDPQATMLGDAQWSWLAEQLREPAELRIIGSSVQVIPNDHGWEKWGNFPHERTRLFQLIRESSADGVVLLSGDRHLAEISCLPTEAPEGVGYPLYDVTSSSLNAASGNMTKAKTRFVNEINSHRIGLTYFETNFGLIEVDWTPDDPVVRLQVRDEAGGVVLQQRVTLSQLR
ncbi:MAG: alkaline phosphatase family protein [Planctomycetaceae bacterium]|nr:alkaline phosphatase family protein [Planctomycetaceae bacterium]